MGWRSWYLLAAAWKIKRATLAKMERGFTMPQWWPMHQMQWEVTLSPVSFLWTRLHRIFLLNQSVRVGEYARVPM